MTDIEKWMIKCNGIMITILKIQPLKHTDKVSISGCKCKKKSINMPLNKKIANKRTSTDRATLTNAIRRCSASGRHGAEQVRILQTRFCLMPVDNRRCSSATEITFSGAGKSLLLHIQTVPTDMGSGRLTQGKLSFNPLYEV